MQPEEPAAQTGEPRLEELAALVHQAYLDTCVRLGWSVKPENLVPYEQLSEDSKELDRASVRAVLNALTEEKQEAEDSRDGFAADLDACEDKVKRLEAENVKLTKWANDANQVSLRYERQRDEERQKVAALTEENAGLRAALKDAVAHHKLASGRCTWCGIVGFHQPGCTVAAWEQALNPKKEQGTDG